MSEDLPKPGDLIGVRYRIESLLGQGGMGAVFSAVNQATGRAVAIKWLLPGAARSQESLARFLSEARATAKIEHPNVIQILDVGQDGEAPFLVMERLRGESLADRLEKGRLSVPEALEVIIPCCRGLAEAHSEGIIHRDIKPDNLFLCTGKDGSKRAPKVLDFGISKLYDQEGGTSLTQTGIAMGTPWYMSPEQLNAPPDADARFDVYAIGVVLYECLAGRPPYNADGLFELVQQIAAGTPTPLQYISPDVPPDLVAVTMRAMHANRDVRYPNMPELVAALDPIRARIQSGAPAANVPMTGSVQQGMPYTRPAGHPASQAFTPAPVQPGTAGLPSTGPMGGGHWTPQAAVPYPSSGGHAAPATGPGYAPSVGAPVMTGAQPGGGRGASIALIALVAAIGLPLVAVIAVGVGFFAFSAGDDSGGTVSTTDDTGGGGVFGGLTAPLANPRDPQIEVTFTGECSPRFNARRMVTGSAGTLSVLSTSAGGVTGSVMLSLDGFDGTVQMSTQQRMDTQMAINVLQGQRLWTNMTIDIMPVRSGRIPDPITGSITITQFDSATAVMDITFNNVSLQNMQDGSICTLNGRLRTNGVTYGM